MLYISCQPTHNESYYNSEFIIALAKAAKFGGASGLRIEGINNINAVIKAELGLPIIGLVKTYDDKIEAYRITAAIADVYNVCQTKCEYVAVECVEDISYDITRERIELVKAHNKIVVADISTLKEAEIAAKAGADYIATTLCGYRNSMTVPAFDLLKSLTSRGYKNLILEGGVAKHSDYMLAIELGASIVVVGTAVTRPDILTRQMLIGE